MSPQSAISRLAGALWHDRLLLARIDENVKALLEGRRDHERRLRTIERQQWAWGGAPP
jgi:hypothetical protein